MDWQTLVGAPRQEGPGRPGRLEHLPHDLGRCRHDEPASNVGRRRRAARGGWFGWPEDAGDREAARRSSRASPSRQSRRTIAEEVQKRAYESSRMFRPGSLRARSPRARTSKAYWRPGAGVLEHREEIARRDRAAQDGPVPRRAAARHHSRHGRGGDVVFLLLRLAPGDPAAILAGDVATAGADRRDPRASSASTSRSPCSSPSWIGRLLQGDLGNSIISKQPVTRADRAAARADAGAGDDTIVVRGDGRGPARRARGLASRHAGSTAA